MATVWTCLVRIKTTPEHGSDDRSHLIEKTSFTIGRTEDADLPLTESSVSRKHLSIELRGPSVFITDLKSGNGTSVNGQKIEGGVAVEITPNDIVKVGLAPHSFQIVSIPKPFEMLDVETKQKSMASSMQDLAVQAERKAREQIEADRIQLKAESESILADARKEAETLKTQALTDLLTKKQMLETEIGELKQQAAVAASQERMKYAKDADQLLAEAQKKIAQDYENASLHIEQQMQASQEKSFALIQDAERRAREAMLEARDEANRVRTSATDEARSIHQEALKKHSTTLTSLQEKFQTDMASRREEILTAARVDAERETSKFKADSAKEITSLEKQLIDLKAEVGPLQERRTAAVEELKNLDEITTQARRELERNSKEVDTVRLMLTRTEQVRAEKEAAEKENEIVQKRLNEAKATVDKEIATLRQKALLELENEKKDSVGDLAKARLKALEDVQKKIQDEEKKYSETLRMRAIELATRINSKVLPLLPELLKEPDVAGARMKAFIEASTRESLLNETSSFVASMVDELAVPKKTDAQKSKRNTQIAVAFAGIAIGVVAFFGKDIYKSSKGSEANTYAAQKMEERKIASVFHPEADARYGTTFRDSYVDNVLFLKGYAAAKTDSLNQQKWLLSLNNDLAQLRAMGLTEDEMVAYTSKENALIKRLGDMRTKIDAMYTEEGMKTLEQAELEDVAEIKKILKTEANYQKIRALERDFAKQLLR